MKLESTTDTSDVIPDYNGVCVFLSPYVWVCLCVCVCVQECAFSFSIFSFGRVYNWIWWRSFRVRSIIRICDACCYKCLWSEPSSTSPMPFQMNQTVWERIVASVFPKRANPLSLFPFVLAIVRNFLKEKEIATTRRAVKRSFLVILIKLRSLPEYLYFQLDLFIILFSLWAT